MLGPTKPWSQHRDSRVVAVDLLGGEDVLADRRHDRVEQPGRVADPIAQVPAPAKAGVERSSSSPSRA